MTGSVVWRKSALSGENRPMKSIVRRAKRASYLSRCRAAARERLRSVLSVDTERTFSTNELSMPRTARAYRPLTMLVTQKLSALEARYGSVK